MATFEPGADAMGDEATSEERRDAKELINHACHLSRNSRRGTAAFG
jgi:hypothetical protein